MKQIALGRLLFTPEKFGGMLLGDFLDAFVGFLKGENRAFKGMAELIRTSTAILWNKQIGPENVLSARNLWPFPWDSQTDPDVSYVSGYDEEKKKICDAQAEYLEEKFR